MIIDRSWRELAGEMWDDDAYYIKKDIHSRDIEVRARNYINKKKFYFNNSSAWIYKYNPLNRDTII